MQKAISFAIVQTLNSGEVVIRTLNLGWTRAVAQRNLNVTQSRCLGFFSLAKVELDYLGMGKMENFNIVKVY